MNEKYGFVEVMTKAREILDGAGRTGGVCEGIKCGKCPFYGNYGYCNFDKSYMHNSPADFADFVMNYEPPVDWSKVAVDTKILVRLDENDEWRKRHFAKYEDNAVWAWSVGQTSFSSDGHLTNWDFAKLYKEDEGE